MHQHFFTESWFWHECVIVMHAFTRTPAIRKVHMHETNKKAEISYTVSS